MNPTKEAHANASPSASPSSSDASVASPGAA
jgi:hypothetical protein